jgi:TP901 family phage tail tape measure protein
MAKKNQSFNISLKLIKTQFDKGIKSVKKQLRTFGSFVKGAFAVGTITAFGRKMVEVGSDFENAMARVKAVTNASKKEFTMMQKEAQRLGETTRYTASEAASALETLTRNGMSATQATKALSGVLQLAQANSIELAQAADIVTNSLNMFGLSVEETTRVNDVLSSTASNSATDITMLYEALTNAAPAAKVLGFSIEETSAAIGALANKGVKGANAGTALRMALTKMADPKIIRKMQDMGVAIDEQTMKEEGLLATVKRLKDAQLSLSDLVAIFSQRGAVGVQQLVDTYEDFEYMLNITKSSAGTTARMFEQGVGSVKKEVDTLKSAYEGLLITLSQKTSGALKGAIRLLQNLIGNFKTIGGTIMNLASVAIPLLTKHVTNLIKVTRTGLKAIKTDAAAVTTMMGNWIGIIATAVTWIGTALVGAWNRVHGAVRDANKEVAKASAEYRTMRTHATYLIDKLGPETNKATLAGVITELSEMFPEFSDAIRKAGAEAAKTGDWEKLKSVLTDIVNLQGQITAKDVYKAQGEAFTDLFARKLNDNNVGRPATIKEINSQLTSEKRGNVRTEQGVEQFWKAVASAITTPDHLPGLDELKRIFNEFQIDLGDATTAAWYTAMRDTDIAKSAIKSNRLASNASKKVNEKSDLVNNTTNTDTSNNTGGNNNNDDLADIAKEKAKIEQKLKDTVADIQDDLAIGVIDQKKSLEELTAAYKEAYEDFRKVDRNGENPYKTKYVDLAVNKIEPIDHSKVTTGKAEAPAEKLPRPTGTQSVSTNISAPFDLEEFMSNLQESTNMLGTMNSIVQNIGSAFSTLTDEEASFMDKLSAAVQIMQIIPGILGTVNTLTQIGTNLRREQNAEDAIGATTKTAGAIASIFQGNGEIPIVGIALAAAGVAALIAALASAPKFATGGIVGGNSFSGDKNFARVNSGEMILNGGQQARLFAMINNGGSNTTHDVNFIIRGKDLYGALKNYNDSTSKIRSNI